MTTIDKTVLILVILVGLTGLAYGYSEVVVEPIMNIVKVLQTAK
jgi:hypothetical protein